jgi:uncharacterized damage-inducible protein DinB
MDTIDAPDRSPTARTGSECEQLESMLDFYRATLLAKCSGLDVERLSARPVPSSELTLLGLLRHAAGNEQWWFERVFAGLEPEPYYQDPDDPDADFHHLDDETLHETLEKLRTSCERSRDLVAGRSLDELAKAPWDGQPVNLRWILIHMIEEYARHCGHADLLRELLDGVTGY